MPQREAAEVKSYMNNTHTYGINQAKKLQSLGINSSCLEQQIDPASFADSDNKLYTMFKLEFFLMKSEGTFKNDNEVEVQILLDNRTDYDWPEEVHIKGKDSCCITKNVDYVIPQKVKKCSVKSVKFTFQAPLGSSLDKQVAVFEMHALDEANNKKYYSEKINVVLARNKPDSIFRLCRFIS